MPGAVSAPLGSYVAGEVLDDEVLEDWLRAAWDTTAGLPPK
ncbi:hypothetical protein T261_8396 [Streptomyces lydicus]|nr:hypothetical protein T261_8396 [Streptomyces lydicus]